MKNIFFLVLIMFLGLSCEDQDTEFQPLAKFSIEQGMVWEYEVNEKEIRDDEIVAEDTYYVKEVVGEPFTFEGEEYFKLLRYEKDLLEGVYRQTDLWSIKKDEFFLTKFEDNEELRKLAFPITSFQEWTLTDADEENGKRKLTYYDINIPYELDLNNYENTFKVKIEDKSTEIDLEDWYEVYDLDRGLIYSSKRTYEYCQSTSDCIGKGIISNGTEISIKII